MAYLRGNTYVDGALNVEGSLIIDSVASSSGNVPFYTDTSVKSKTDSIIKVNDTDGAITSTDLYATEIPANSSQENPAEGLYLEYSLSGSGSKLYIDNGVSHKSGVSGTVFRLNVTDMKWHFYDVVISDGKITSSKVIKDIV